MTTLYAPTIPAEAIGAAILAAAREWRTEAIQHAPTAFDEGDTVAHVWLFEITGNTPGGWHIFGRDARAEVDLATMTVTLTDGND